MYVAVGKIVKYIKGIKKIIITLQGKEYGANIFDFAESLAKITQIDCVSCWTDLFPFY